MQFVPYLLCAFAVSYGVQVGDEGLVAVSLRSAIGVTRERNAAYSSSACRDVSKLLILAIRQSAAQSQDGGNSSCYEKSRVSCLDLIFWDNLLQCDSEDLFSASPPQGEWKDGSIVTCSAIQRNRPIERFRECSVQDALSN